MIAELQCMVLDCPDPLLLAEFYAALLDGEVNRPDKRWAVGADWATVHTGSGLVRAFQRVDGHRPPRWPDPRAPQQAHPDFTVRDLDRAQERVLALGATLLDGAPGRDGGSRRVFADPAGHLFCLLRH
ncbi:VOC family protein [Streptomyces nitrosporeus]|uniref:VOC family protein n=1 Tax=Streptomyces nitrosporeus TaxID=28894 RepID=UPI003327B3FD